MSDPKKPVTFPYKTLEAAQKDAFKKVGGPEKAFALLVKGFKSEAWRKRTDASAKERDAAHEAALGGGKKVAVDIEGIGHLDAVSPQGGVEHKSVGKITFPVKKS